MVPGFFQKVSVHLLDTVLVVGRTVSRAGVGKILQVYKDPIPLQLLDCQDMADGEGGKQGSFHRAFSSSASTSRLLFSCAFCASSRSNNCISLNQIETPSK